MLSFFAQHVSSRKEKKSQINSKSFIFLKMSFLAQEAKCCRGRGPLSRESSWQRLGPNCWPWICWRRELLWETHAMECDVACSSRRGRPGTRAGIMCHQPGPSPAPLNFWCQHNLKTSTWKENKALNTSYGSSAVVMVRYKNVKIQM